MHQRHAELLAFIRGLPIQGAKQCFNALDLCDGRVLRDMARSALIGVPPPAHGDRTSASECFREIIDLTIEEHGISVFAVEHWPHRCALRLAMDGVDSATQMAVLESAAEHAERERRRVAELQTEEEEGRLQHKHDKPNTPGTPSAWGDSTSPKRQMPDKKKAGHKHYHGEQQSWEAANGWRGSPTDARRLPAGVDKDPSKGGGGDLPPRQRSPGRRDSTVSTSEMLFSADKIDDVMWVAALLVWKMGGAFHPPPGSHIVYTGPKARTKRAEASVNALLRSMSASEYSKLMWGTVQLQARLRRLLGRANSMEQLRASSLRGLESKDWAVGVRPYRYSRGGEDVSWLQTGEEGTPFRGQTPMNTPMTSYVQTVPRTSMTAMTGHTQTNFVDSPGPPSATPLPPLGPYIPRMLKGPWEAASCVSAQDGLVVVAAGAGVGVYDLSSSEWQRGDGGEELEESGIPSSTSVRLMVEVHRGETSITATDCSVQWGFVRSLHLHPATPGVSRLTSRYALEPGSYQQASRLALGTPVLARFKTRPKADMLQKTTLVGAGDSSGRVVIVNVRNGEVINEFDVESSGRVEHLKILESGGAVASLHADGHLVVWDLQRGGAMLFQARLDHGPYLGIAEVGGWLLVASSGDISVEAWQINTLRSRKQRHVQLFQQSEPTCWCSGVLKESTMVATGGKEGTLRVWRKVGSNTQPSLLFGHKKQILSICCSSWRIVTGGSDSVARVWDARELKCVAVLQGHVSEVSGVWCDERQVLTGSVDGEIRSWSPITGTCNFRLKLNGQSEMDVAVLSITLLSQQQRVLSLVTRSLSGAVVLWLPPANASSSITPEAVQVFGETSPRDKQTQRRKHAKLASPTKTSEARSMFGHNTAKRTPLSISLVKPSSPGSSSHLQLGMGSSPKSPPSSVFNNKGHPHGKGSQPLNPNCKWFGSRSARVTVVAPTAPPSAFDSPTKADPNDLTTMPWHGRAGSVFDFAGEDEGQARWVAINSRQARSTTPSGGMLARQRGSSRGDKDRGLPSIVPPWQDPHGFTKASLGNRLPTAQTGVSGFSDFTQESDPWEGAGHKDNVFVGVHQY